MRTASGPAQAGLADGLTDGLTVLVLARPPSARLVLRGELDLQTAGTLAAALARAERSSGCRYEVDLQGVGFADCTGARPLLDLARRAADAGGEVVLWGPSPRVALVLAHLGLVRGVPRRPVTPRGDDLPGPQSGA